jgi:tetratricopeptide (TPR) repeat protein
LIDADTDEHLWAETYDRDYSDIFAIQSDVAVKVANALNATLNPDERLRLATVPTSNMEAYDYYIRGNVYSNSVITQETVENAIEMYEKAVALDPNFAIAFVRLAIEHLTMYWDSYRYDHTNERLKKAKDALDKASALDPDLPGVHAAQGYYYYWGSRDYINALNHFEIAIEGQPNNAGIVAAIGYVNRRMGKWDIAFDNIIKSSDLDPNNYNKAYEVVNTAMKMRNWTMAKKYTERLLIINPEEPRGYNWKIHIPIVAHGDIVKANETLEEAMKKIHPKELINVRGLLAYCEHNYNKALDISKEASSSYYLRNKTLNISEKDSSSSYLWKGWLKKLLGHTEESIAFYDTARGLYEQRIKNYPDLARYYSSLGAAYAGLGKKKEAVMFGEKAVRMLPISRDAVTGARRLYNLVLIYLDVGEYSKVIDNLEILLSIPSTVTVHELKIYPDFDPLRDHPRFQELIKKYQ